MFPDAPSSLTEQVRADQLIRLERTLKVLQSQNDQTAQRHQHVQSHVPTSLLGMAQSKVLKADIQHNLSMCVCVYVKSNSIY